jgi:zinc transporter, ZIP family
MCLLCCHLRAAVLPHTCLCSAAPSAALATPEADRHAALQVTSTRRRNGTSAVEGKVDINLKKLGENGVYGVNGVNGVNGAHANGTSKVTEAVKTLEAPATKKGERSLAQDLVPFVSLITLMGAITYLTMPASLAIKTPTVQHVWFYGWLAAITTGLGALPLLFFSKPADFWLGACNAIAAGMMLSASYSLVTEGVALDHDGGSMYGYEVSHTVRVVCGVLLGMMFVRCTKSFVEGYEDLRLGDISGLEAAKIFLIVSVMTLHSFAEGLGIGVAFCGKGGAHLGAFISASLAVHNVPEGLAVALVLVPRGVPKFQTFAMAIMSSLPQPIIAVPVYLFVEQFIFWESVGLGFAAGLRLPPTPPPSPHPPSRMRGLQKGVTPVSIFPSLVSPFFAPLSSYPSLTLPRRQLAWPTKKTGAHELEFFFSPDTHIYIYPKTCAQEPISLKPCSGWHISSSTTVFFLFYFHVFPGAMFWMACFEPS